MACINCNSSNSSSVYSRINGTKIIKIDSSSTGAKLNILENGYSKAKIELCDINILYDQFFHTSMYMERGANNREISWTSIGTQVTYVAIRVKYTENEQACCSSYPDPYLTYIFETNPKEIRYIKDFMILTGTEDTKIPKIFLSNPSTKYNATVDIIAATTDITFEPVVSTIGDDIISIENLEYNNINSDADNVYVKRDNNILLTMRWIDITFNSDMGDFYLNNSIISISDYVQNTINLSFIDSYNAAQTYSLLKWAVTDTENNIIDNNLPDNEAPTILLKNIDSIVLEDFPPTQESTCGLDGTSMCVYDYIGTNGLSIIYKEDLFTYLVKSVTDNRDINVDYSYNDMTIRNVLSSNYIDAISELGHYFIEINIKDYAGNLATESFILNVKDLGYPKLIVSDLGYELYSYNNETTSNIINTILNESSYIFEPNSYDMFNVTYNSTSASLGYIILNNYPIEFRLTETYDIVFDDEQLGNGALTWSLSDLGLTQIFTVNSVSYAIEYVDYYKISITKI